MHNEEMAKQLEAMAEFSTPQMSDALDAIGIKGYLSNIKPIGIATRLIGPAYTVQYQSYREKPKNFMQAGQYIDEVPEGAVIIIDNNGLTTCSVWGGILTHFAQLKKLAGTVVNGLVRDADALAVENYPVFALGVTACTGKNRVYASDQRCALSIDGVVIQCNDIVVADSNGVLIIPKDKVNEVLKMTHTIARNEEHIIHAINNGKTLKEAREAFHYDTPWIDSKTR